MALAIESVFHDNNLGVATRIGLHMASQNGRFWRKVSKDRAMALTMAGQIEALVETQRTLHWVAEVMNAAHFRLCVALACHEDMQAIAEESKAHAVIGGSL